jgi:hypothetical protein
MPDSSLAIHCGGSTFSTPLSTVRRWRHVLDCADAISLLQNGAERVHVQLGGLRRWIAFERAIGGSPFACVGYQETVGARPVGLGAYTGGSNRKVLAWVNGGGEVFIGDKPDVPRRPPRGIVWLTADGEARTEDDVPEVLG